MIGQRLGHYRVLEKIGAGGMGEVYRAHDEQLDRDVAIKVVSTKTGDDPAARQRLLREARAAAALNHPHICTIYEVGEGEVDTQPYIAMEWIDGDPLDRLIPAEGLVIEHVFRYGLQITDAVAHAHDRRIVHRDLKTANALITPQGNAKVLDFGLAKRSGERELAEATTQSKASPTQGGALAGTLPYMAPEQFCAQAADTRSDVWALGVMLYEMAAGARPFRGRTGFEVSSAILKDAPALLPAKVPAELRALIGRCLEKEPERRYQRAGEVHAALQAIHVGTVAPSTSRYQLTPRHWSVFGGSLLVLLAVLAGLDVGALRDRLARRVAAPPATIKLAVLPLQNLTGDPDQEYFSDGMTEEMITQLGRLHPRGLTVIARTSSMRYKKSDKPVDQIGDELGVDYLLEGSSRREGGRVRITTQLIRVRDQTQVWAETYERGLAGILVLQSDVARAVSQSLALTLLPGDEARPGSVPLVNPEAYEAYLKGRFHWNMRTEQDLRKAVEYFSEAIEKEPGSPLGHAGLADAYSMLAFFSVLPPREAMPRAKEAALRALEINEALAEAHNALAYVRSQYDWDWVSAEREFRRALDLNPNYAPARQWYSASYLARMGRAEEAIAEASRAWQIDPVSPIGNVNVAQTFYYARQYDRAIEYARKALDMDPNFVTAHGYLGLAYAQQRAWAPAVAAAQKARDLSGGNPLVIALAARTYGVCGRRAEAQDLLRELETLSKRRYVDPGAIAMIQFSIGEDDRGFERLEQAYQERSHVMVALKSEPFFDRLRPDPRFQSLLRRVGLSP